MIRLEKVGKKFPEFEIIDVSLEVQAGEYFIILGPTGSGKTLLLEMISGLIKQDSGRIQGIEQSRFGLIYQDYMLFPHLNVAQNIGYGLRIQKMQRPNIENTVASAARKLGISHLLHRSTANLSGGEKQRVAIARAMVLEPEVYLFDEPTAALDLSSKIHIQRLFMQLHKELRSTVIHVTHDFEEALALGDRIAILMNGRLVQVDTPETIFSNPATRSVADFMGYKNVFSGKIRDHRFQIGGLEISTLAEQSELAYIAIRSNDILLSQLEIQSSARNSFCGNVNTVINRGNHMEVVLDIGCQEMGIRQGTRLWATFKTVSVKVFEH
jgi:ABC-type sugar transport system ATPase subunit